jgi:hypothetical protein
MKVPPRRAIKGFKDPANHRDVFVMTRGGIDQIANDKRKPPEQVRAELRALKERCSYHLAGYLTEAVTGKPLPCRGLRVWNHRKRKPE